MLRYLLDYGIVSLLAASPLTGWKPAGDARHVSIEGSGAVVLSAAEPTTAGAVSPPHRLPPGCDAMLVIARIQDAAAAALTLSIHDERGQTLGYWRNPTSINEPSPVAAAIPLQGRARQARLYIGTHDAPAKARIEAVHWLPVRQEVIYRGTQYGALIDAQHSQAQLFVASGKELAAVTVRVRQLQPSDEGNLRVRLYAIEGNNVAAAYQHPPLDEQIVARSLLPPAEEDAAQTITVPLRAELTIGRRYLVEFGCDSANGLLMWGGPDEYAKGMRVENGNPIRDWDLHVTLYYAQ